MAVTYKRDLEGVDWEEMKAVVKADDLDFSRDEDIMDLVDQIKKMKKSPLYYVPLGKGNKDSKKLK